MALMVELRPYFVRGDVQRLAGLSRNQFENWLRVGIVRPDAGGGGKGQPLKFDAYSATVVAILAKIEFQMGLNTRALVDFANRFYRAKDFVEANNLHDVAESAASLAEYRQDILRDGFTSYNESIRLLYEDFAADAPRYKTPGGEGCLKLDWPQIVDLHRRDEARLRGGVIEDKVVRLCEAMTRDEFLCLCRYNALIHAKSLAGRQGYLLVWREDGGEWIDHFDDSIDPKLLPSAFCVLDVRRLKLELFGKP